MRYLVDHDYHIHSQLSRCSHDPLQTPEAILEYGRQNGYRRLCLTDHFWEKPPEGVSRFYEGQDFAHVCQCLPLPQGDGIEFLFGVETEMTKDGVIGVLPEHYDAFDFIVIPISHFHMVGTAISHEDAATAKGKADAFIRKLSMVLDQPLPFHKVGLAHLINGFFGREDMALYRRVIELILSREELPDLLSKAATVGVGIELNTACLKTPEVEDLTVRFYSLAKDRGCKFYFCTDAHHPEGFLGAKAICERMVDLLGLTEDDKFHIGK